MFDMENEVPVFQNNFWTISNEDGLQNGHFESPVEYPIWVFIKRTLTGKLVLDCQILIYCIHFKENIKNRPKELNSENALVLMVFGRFLQNWYSK